MAEVMLPYLNVAPGLTLYQAYAEDERLAITSSGES
jgi:hypothetical protein